MSGVARTVISYLLLVIRSFVTRYCLQHKLGEIKILCDFAPLRENFFLTNRFFGVILLTNIVNSLDNLEMEGG